MSELTLLLIRFAYLAMLWIFVLSAVSGHPLRHVRRPRRPPGGRRQAADPAAAPQEPQAPPRLAVQVTIVEGANRGETVSLDHAPLLIGRGNDAAIRLDDDYVSTRHARIAANRDQWYVEDLGSTNGTYVGTTRITQPTTLTLGTQVRIGKTILELRK